MAKPSEVTVTQGSKEKLLNHVTQFAIPLFTLGGQAAIAIKFPQYGLVLILLAQPFWLYSAWKSYKHAGQSGMLITSIAMTLLATFGVINYWFL